jgi:virginiamycin A acetyltransferase
VDTSQAIPNANHVPPPYVTVGRYTYYDPNDIRFLTYVADERIVVGQFCSLASGTLICAGGHHATDTVSTWPFDNFFLGRENPTRTYRSSRPTVLGNDVWTGCRAHIMPGVHVGNGAVVAAHAVVFSDVPDYAIVAGNPARVVRYRFSSAVVQRLLRIAWWDWPEEKIRANLEWFYRPVTEFVEQFDPAGGNATDGNAARAA